MTLERLEKINPHLKVSLDTVSKLIDMESRWNQKVGQGDATIIEVIEKLLPNSCKEFQVKVLVREQYYYADACNKALLFACKKCVFIYEYKDEIATVIFFG